MTNRTPRPKSTIIEILGVIIAAISLLLALEREGKPPEAPVQSPMEQQQKGVGPRITSPPPAPPAPELESRPLPKGDKLVPLPKGDKLKSTYPRIRPSRPDFDGVRLRTDRRDWDDQPWD